MGVEESVLDKLRELPPDKQQEVLDFVEFLREKSAVKVSHRSLRGLWADLGVDISEEDITEVRRDMWGEFPRNDVE